MSEEKKYEVTAEFLKDLHKHVCCDIQEDLEKHYPEVFKKEDVKFEVGQIWLKSGRFHVQPGILSYAGGEPLKITYLNTGEWDPEKVIGPDFWLMKSGTVTITIENGLVSHAVVRED